MGHLVLVGGGHAHAGVLFGMADLIKAGHRVTLVNLTAQHYYSGMGPGVLGEAYTPEEITFPVRNMVLAAGGEFVEDRVLSVDAVPRTLRLASGDTLPYDVLSLNAGSVIPTPQGSPEPQGDVYTVKPIQNLWHGGTRIKELLSQGEVRVAVVGGGPAALEVAGNVAGLGERYTGNCGGRVPQVRVFAGRAFLKSLPDKARALARKSFKQRGIEILENGYVASAEAGQVVMESGERFEADVIFLALGVKPPALFADSGLPTGFDGGMAVNEFLQCTAHPEIFGGGDCIHFSPRPLDKVGVFAVRQHPVLTHNLHACLEGRELIPFDPGGPYLLVFNLGNGHGIFIKKNILFGGRLAFFIKDVIDRRFMRQFRPWL